MSHKPTNKNEARPTVLTYTDMPQCTLDWCSAWQLQGFRTLVITPDMMQKRFPAGYKGAGDKLPPPIARWIAAATFAPEDAFTLFVDMNVVPAKDFMIDVHMLRYAEKKMLVVLGGVAAVLAEKLTFHRYLSMLAAYQPPDVLPADNLDAAAMIHTRDHFPEFIMDFDKLRVPDTCTPTSLIDATCWDIGEPQLRRHMKQNPLTEALAGK